MMASQGLSNEDVKEVVNYVLNSWGNEGGEVTIADVEAALSE
jgi:mono/diheme cytochrome c family protein